MGIANRSRTKFPIAWDVILFFSLYVVMPSYFALEFTQSLPLVTISRAVLVLMLVMLVIRKRGLLRQPKALIRQLNPGLCVNPILRWGLVIYFVLIVAVNLMFVTQTSDALKSVVIVILEQYLLIWALTLLLDTRAKLDAAIKVLVISSGVTGLIAVISCMLEYNLFYLLNTVTRDSLMANYYRMGVLRAEAGFGHPVYYGAFCAVMLPFAIHYLEESDRKWKSVVYSACIVLNIMGLFLSNSRGSMLACAVTAVVMIPLKFISGMTKKIFWRYIRAAAATIAALVLFSAISSTGIGFLDGVAGSLVSIINPESGQLQTPSVSAPADIDTPEDTTATTPTQPSTQKPDYGDNKNGVRSRLVQLTGVEWTLEHSPWIGFGPNAHTRGLVRFQFHDQGGKWTVTKTLDMELVSLICQYGVIGFLGFAVLYSAIILVLLKKKVWKEKLNLTFGFTFICYYLCMLSIVSIKSLNWVLIGLLVCYLNLRDKKLTA